MMKNREQAYLMREFCDLMGFSNEYRNTRLKEAVNTTREQENIKKQRMKDLQEKASSCRECELYAARKELVFGEGSVDASLMFIGEAPGGDEDITGRPFVGRAGKKLTEMIENKRSLGIPRKEVFICNILKCRPPGNRNPKPSEVQSCTPLLFEQIEIIEPRVICALGTFAAQWLLNTKTPISHLRGKVGVFRDIKVVATYHPSYIIRNPSNVKIRKEAWDDMLLIKNLLNEAPNGGN